MPSTMNRNICCPRILFISSELSRCKTNVNQRTHIEAGRNGSLYFQNGFRAYGQFGGKPKTKWFNITRSVSEKQAKAAAEEWLAEMRSKEDIRNDRIAKAAIEKSARILRQFQVINGMLDQISNNIDV